MEAGTSPSAPAPPWETWRKLLPASPSDQPNCRVKLSGQVGRARALQDGIWALQVAASSAPTHRRPPIMFVLLNHDTLAGAAYRQDPSCILLCRVCHRGPSGGSSATQGCTGPWVDCSRRILGPHSLPPEQEASRAEAPGPLTRGRLSPRGPDSHKWFRPVAGDCCLPQFPLLDLQRQKARGRKKT